MQKFKWFLLRVIRNWVYLVPGVIAAIAALISLPPSAWWVAPTFATLAILICEPFVTYHQVRRCRGDHHPETER